MGVVGLERVGTSFPHLFRRGNAFPHLFALATLLEDVASKILH